MTPCCRCLGLLFTRHPWGKGGRHNMYHPVSALIHLPSCPINPRWRHILSPRIHSRAFLSHIFTMALYRITPHSIPCLAISYILYGVITFHPAFIPVLCYLIYPRRRHIVSAAVHFSRARDIKRHFSWARACALPRISRRLYFDGFMA